jgi:hypothetical protein
VSKDEMQSLLRAVLGKYATLSHADLADAMRRNKNVLETTDGTASDGSFYQIEANAIWDSAPGGSIRVIADLCVDGGRLLLGFLPIYWPDAIEDFIMRPDGSFIE